MDDFWYNKDIYIFKDEEKQNNGYFLFWKK